MPPDSELVEMIEQAFLEGQIDGLKAEWPMSICAGRRAMVAVCPSLNCRHERDQQKYYVGLFVVSTKRNDR